MKMIKILTAVVASACLAATPLREASAAPHWNKSVKCEETDPEGRVIPTRYGHAALGWNHFSGKHNIKKCRVVDAALAGKVDKKNGGRLEYYGVARNQTRPDWSRSWSSCSTRAVRPMASTTQAGARRSVSSRPIARA
ncbi:hypothetical protein LRE75_23960 [Streptomyces sp. 372A]